MIALLSAIMYVSQVVLSFIPNVNVITLLFVLYIYLVGYRKTTVILVVFTFLMGITYGYGFWLLGYLWIYSILLIVTVIIKKLYGAHSLTLSVLGGLFGFLFGFLFAVHNHFFLGIDIVPYYINGLWFDVIHACSNFIAISLLFTPLYKNIKMQY